MGLIKGGFTSWKDRQQYRIIDSLEKRTLSRDSQVLLAPAFARYFFASKLLFLAANLKHSVLFHWGGLLLELSRPNEPLKTRHCYQETAGMEVVPMQKDQKTQKKGFLDLPAGRFAYELP